MRFFGFFYVNMIVMRAKKAWQKTPPLIDRVPLQIRQPGLARRLSLGPSSSAEGEEEPRPDGGRRIDLPGQTDHNFSYAFRVNIWHLYAPVPALDKMTERILLLQLSWLSS